MKDAIARCCRDSLHVPGVTILRTVAVPDFVHNEDRLSCWADLGY